MRRPTFTATWDAADMVADNFAGGGGASTGIEQALARPVSMAVNHDPVALAMHAANHPETRHYCESVLDIDPVEVCAGRRVGLAWFSPDCTHFSRAKGGKPRSKDVRGLAWVAIRWAREVRPRVIILENVEEFTTWGPLDDDGQPIRAQAGETFEEFVRELTGLGYVVEWRTLVAADYGAPTTRKRLFLVARADGQRPAWPAQTHGAGAAEPWRAAAEIIDWSHPCPSIFGRKRPLADKTLARIAHGIRKYVLEAAQPFIIPLTHAGTASRVHDIGDPLRTVTAANRGELGLVTPTLVSHYGQSVGRPATEPVPTITAGGGGHHGLLAPTLIQTGYGERKGQTPRSLDLGVPLGTVVAGGAKHGLVAAYLAKHNGGPHGGAIGRALDCPSGTITAKDQHALVAAHITKFYGTSTGSDARAPLPTVTAGGHHFGAVQALLRRAGADAPPPLLELHGATWAIVDVGMRMLQPNELYAAQGFPTDYNIAPMWNGKPLTKTAQIHLAGNSVPPPLARALVEANLRSAA